MYARQRDISVQSENFIEKFVLWCRGTLLPFWADNGIDRQNGGFFEQLYLDGIPDRTVARRVRVASRQIYSFAHAQHLGWLQDQELILNGVDWLLDKGWAVDGNPGFLHLLDDGGQPLDASRDLYDHAFHILGLSWAYRATKDAQVLSAARRTFDFVEEALASKQGGWHENLAHALPRRQNPHMHMFEALLALYECSGDSAYLKRADEIAVLLAEKFVARNSALLHEFFDADWSAHTPAQIEPGHMAEWSWLLQRRAMLTADAAKNPLAGRLLANAERLGKQQNGLLIDTCDTAANPTKDSCRLWNQSEWLKALMIAAPTPAQISPAIDDLLQRIFAHYLNQPNPALWIDAICPNNEAISDRVPASIVYHLVSAASEAERIFLDPKPRNPS
ncbi:Mannose-6-phosphate isomerase [hydrothermal vent metagenome]|uniref:Mannose-6-phosphate isomerase n=1 Tax=hydrothermal vent metagenome TaxID=652676 RepID=A0A3B0SLY7_9ZZZZ